MKCSQISRKLLYALLNIIVFFMTTFRMFSTYHFSTYHFSTPPPKLCDISLVVIMRLCCPIAVNQAAVR